MDDVLESIVSPGEVKSFIDRKLTGPFSEMGLTPSEGIFIKEIGLNQGVSLKALSEQMGVDKALTTRKVASLIDKGFVHNDSSGHEYNLILTEEGEAAFLRIKREI